MLAPAFDLPSSSVAVRAHTWGPWDRIRELFLTQVGKQELKFQRINRGLITMDRRYTTFRCILAKAAAMRGERFTSLSGSRRLFTAEEFMRMLRATRSVVGREFAREWRFALRILGESGFRIGELLQFSWDDDQQIHPVWPVEGNRHPTIIVPPTQKNRRLQETPLLPGLHKPLLKVPERCRQGNVVTLRLKSKFTEPLSVDCISRTIARIGQQANVVVKKANATAGTRTKYASAHDLRRGCAAKLINARVSAETLKVVMRHADFGTTEKHYGAIRSA